MRGHDSLKIDLLGRQMQVCGLTLFVLCFRSLYWNVLLGLLLLNCRMDGVPNHFFIASLGVLLIEAEI